jgi:hypothetical protein
MRDADDEAGPRVVTFNDEPVTYLRAHSASLGSLSAPARPASG